MDFCSRENVLFGSRHSAIHKSSNNPLAVEPETENDAGLLNFFRKHIRDFNSVEAAIPSATQELQKMIDTFKRATKLAPLLAIAVLFAAPVRAQAPSEAQREAIKSECRSDYMAHCSSVPPGGEASLQCLQKNMSSLSSGCQGAVRAVEAPAAPKAESAPAATTAKPAETATPKSAAPAAAAASKPAEPKAAAAQPSSAQISAVRSACRSDYPKVCAGVPTGGAPALQCLEKNKAKLSAGCGKAVAAVSGGGAAAPAAATAPAASGAAPAAAAAPAVIVLRPMRPREELFVLRSACGGDVRSICGGVAPGGGRIVQCLATNAASLSPACKDVLAPFAAR
jgi:hypothetical protein